MSCRCQWNIVPWAHISFPSQHRATASSRERGPGTKFKNHFTASNKGANGSNGREENVTWKGCRRWMGSSLLAVWWLLVPNNRNTSIPTQQFFFVWNTWNPPSSLKATVNIPDTDFFALWDWMQNVSLEDCFLWFKGLDSFKMLFNSVGLLQSELQSGTLE